MLPLAAQLRLDSLVSQSVLTSGAYLAIQLYGERGELYSRDDKPGGIYRSAAAIEAYGVELINQQSDGRRQAFAMLSIESLNRYVQLIVDFVAHSRFEDMTVGGCLEPRRRKNAMDRRGRISNKQARRLQSPKAIRRYVKREREVQHLRELLALVLSIRAPADERDRSELPDVVALYNEEVERQRRRQIIDRETWATMHKTPKRLRIERQRSRQIIKRGLPLASSIVGEDRLRSFVRGDEIAIPGEAVILLLKAQSSLGSIGHGGIGVTFADLTGRKLARGCIYHEKTPTIDQLTAFTLAMQAGDEAELIETANLFHIEPGGEGHPLIAKRVREAIEHGRVRYMGGEIEKTVFEAGRAEHMRKMGAIYKDAIEVHVFGRRSVNLSRALAP
jgi:hypothetical protein